MSWLLQAESDLRSVTDLIRAGHFAQACFNAQQASAKSLKALAYFRGADMVKFHSLGVIAKDLGLNGELASYSSKLDVYYLTARYPDALPDNAVPAELFDQTMATEANAMAQVFLHKVKAEIAQ